MGKFNTTVNPTVRSSALEALANKGTVQLPVQPEEDITAEMPMSPAINPQTAMDPSQNLYEAPELPDAYNQAMDPQQQFEADLAEQQRQAVPDMRKRWANPSVDNIARKATASADVDGGIFSRAKQMAQAVETGGLVPPVSLRNTAGFKVAESGGSSADIAEAIAAERDGSIQAAVTRIGAVNQADPRAPKIDPDFILAGSMATEHMLMEFAAGASELEADADVETADFDKAPLKKVTKVAKQQGNAAVGNQIALEYQRLKGNEAPAKLPTKEAETLGDAFKMMWVSQNPNLAKVIRDPATNQKFIELTPEGEAVLEKGQTDRKRLFPTNYVRPAKSPSKTGKLPGDTGQNVVKNVQGQVGKQKFGDVLDQAIVNLGQIPNVVDKQRMRLLYATALPVIRDNNYSSPSATINNLGLDKLAKYEAKHGKDVAMEEMNKATFKLAQEIQAVAMERNGANYLTYAIQGFQGRISPQQSKFNPTTSKAVRFVTRNAVPAPAKPGSRVDYNLRQMYAMMLVPGADEVLPEIREQKFEAYASQIEAWGDRLEAALQMSDAEAEAISQAIEKGISLSDPSFPPIKPVALDPQQDAELIAKIKSKGEDGLHFMDGLMDAAKYLKARRAGKTHHSYFNAYIDGKTNGIASNGIQMGNSKTARQTGVMRYSKEDYLDEHGDVRQVLRDELMAAVDNVGFTGTHEYASEMNAVARAVFNHRDLNKKTTMTFGYGKEIETFWVDMYETAMLLKTDPSQIKDAEMREAFVASIDTVLEKLQDEDGKGGPFGQTLMTLYKPALESVMSPEALASRNIMRSVATMFSMTNQLMTMKGPTGMDMHFGREVVKPGEYTETSYRIGRDGDKTQHSAIHQETELTSAAPRMYEDKPAYGDYAYGGSVVGPVQALDAAAVALSVTGKSWNRMKKSSGGNPYVHTIYDAFKSDAMSYDTILEEVNQNWLDAAMNWSYLEQAKESVNKAMTEWKAEMRKRDPKSKISENEAAYIKAVMAPKKSNSGNLYMPMFFSKIATAGNFEKRGINLFDAAKHLQQRMRSVGFEWTDPPAELTVAQLQTFVDVIEKLLDTNNRLSKAIAFTNKNKGDLRKEILKDGYKTKSGKVIPLQYYAH